MGRSRTKPDEVMFDPADPSVRRRILKIKQAFDVSQMRKHELVERAGISSSTIEKTLAFQIPVSARTFDRLEAVFGLTDGADSLRSRPERGGYDKTANEHLAGSYYFIRPAFERPMSDAAIAAFRMQIDWDPAARCFCLYGQSPEARQTNEAKRWVAAEIAIRPNSAYLYYLFEQDGHLSVMITHPRDFAGIMHGSLLTLANIDDGDYKPVLLPAALIYSAERIEPGSRQLGTITPGQAAYTAYAAVLDRAIRSKAPYLPASGLFGATLS